MTYNLKRSFYIINLYLIVNKKGKLMFIEIYGRLTCPYCTRAIALAEKIKENLENVDFKYIDMPSNNISKEDLEPKVGKAVKTVPQIFLDDQPIGGFTEFSAYVKQEFGI